MIIKTCTSCGFQGNMFRSKPLLCRNCANRSHVSNDNAKGEVLVHKSPIKAVSDKQAKINQAYTVLRKQFLKDYTECQVKLHVCSGIATQIHHCYSGSNKRKHYLDSSTYKAICADCHRVLHDDLSADELYFLGLKIRT